jgi:group II intron reverse transcriptase/maturase
MGDRSSCRGIVPKGKSLRKSERSNLRNGCRLTWPYSSTAAGDNSLSAKGVSGGGSSKVYARSKQYVTDEWVIRKPETKDGQPYVGLIAILVIGTLTLLTDEMRVSQHVPDLLSEYLPHIWEKMSEGHLLNTIIAPLQLPVNLASSTRGTRDRGLVVPKTVGRSLNNRRNHSSVNNLTKSNEDTGKLEQGSSKTIQRLRDIRYHAQRPGFRAKGLTTLMKDVNLWVAAYQKISSNRGSMTPGADKATIDGTSMKTLRAIRDSVLKGTYLFGTGRRRLIPKPQGGQRPLTIPAIQDRIVQEVIRSVLEPVYEPIFSERSHGFRPNRSQHTALKDVRKHFKGASWYIEGDISKFFDKVNHNLMKSLLLKRVDDRKFVNLIDKILKARVLDENKNEIYPTIGTPQGGVISPLLSNIVLHELDQFMEGKIKEFNKGERRRMNPEYKRLYKRGGVKLARSVKYGDHWDPNYRRMGYVRYADDFLVAVIGTKQEAEEARGEIREFLKATLKLELNMEKTYITNIGLKPVGFLGYNIARPTPKMYTYQKAIHIGTRTKTRVLRSSSVYLMPDTNSIVNRLASKGFCTKGGDPRPNFYYLPQPQSVANQNVSSILRGLERYYHLAENKRQIINRISYIVRFSMAKMFAAKFKLGSMKKVFRMAGRDLSGQLKAKEALGITDEKLGQWTPGGKPPVKAKGLPFTRYKEIPRPDIGVSTTRASHLQDPLRSLEWRTIRGNYALGRPCSICGTYDNVEMHHVKGLKYIKGKTLVEKQMMAAMRKQIPLCRTHHLQAHGKRSGKKNETESG